MPIHVGAELHSISEEVFKEIAYAVTGIAFAMHKEYGSFFGEKLYKYEIAAECRKNGLRPAIAEVPIRVTYRDFTKPYRADLLVVGGALFELKVVTALNDEHRAQTLHYLFLTGLQRAKLINLGAPSVEHEFVSTTLTPDDRKQLFIHDDRWLAPDAPSARFFELLTGMLDDWGGFLQLPLYTDALTHFFGGEDMVIQEIPVIREGVEVVKQKVHLINSDTAFKLTALSGCLNGVEDHLRRFLSHTRLRAIQWVNLHHHDITFTTLLNRK